MIDFKDFNENISDEMLAAYIDGNATPFESSLIESTLDVDNFLSESLDIANDTISFGSNFDWDIHKGDYGFWELGIPPAITEDEVVNDTLIKDAVEDNLSLDSVCDEESSLLFEDVTVYDTDNISEDSDDIDLDNDSDGDYMDSDDFDL